MGPLRRRDLEPQGVEKKGLHAIMRLISVLPTENPSGEVEAGGGRRGLLVRLVIQRWKRWVELHLHTRREEAPIPPALRLGEAIAFVLAQ